MEIQDANRREEAPPPPPINREGTPLPLREPSPEVIFVRENWRKPSDDLKKTSIGKTGFVSNS